MFYQPVDMQSRKDLIAFLTDHFRYYTMHSCNRSTSYANNIKLHKTAKPADIDQGTARVG